MSVSTPKRIIGGTCAICQKPNTTLLINFGVFSCYSCRAFFRRAQNVLFNNESLFCSQDETCEINVLKRKFLCRKCRYVKCVEHGMDASMVLDEEGRKKRFTKESYKYKTKKDRQQQAQRERPQSEEYSSLGQQQQPQQQQQLSQARLNRHQLLLQQYHHHQQLQQHQLQQEQLQQQHRIRAPPVPMMTPPHVSETSMSGGSSCGLSISLDEECDYGRTPAERFTPPSSHPSSPTPTIVGSTTGSSRSSPCLKAANTPSSSSCVSPSVERNNNDILRILFEVNMRNLDLRLYFQNKLANEGKQFKLSNLKHCDLRHLINSLCFQYHQFARSLDCFQELRPEDQMTLLRQNTPNFIQFVLSKAFSSVSGFHQLNNLVAQTICGTENILDDAISPLEFEDFAEMTGMFQGDYNRLNIYGAFVKKLAVSPCLTEGLGFHLMAALILFCRNNAAMENSQLVDSIHAEHLEMFVNQTGESNLLHYFEAQKLFRLMTTLQME